jgi:hypothetical protein
VVVKYSIRGVEEQVDAVIPTSFHLNPTRVIYGDAELVASYVRSTSK